MTFVQRLALAKRCGHAPLVDLSGVLGDARALQQLVAALWRPFAQLRVAQAVALLPAATSSSSSSNASDRHSASRALAAALAAAHHLSYSELEVTPLEPPTSPPPAKRKRGRRRPSLAHAPVHPELVCRRVARVDVGGQRRVQLQRQTLAPGRKVLLVVDWLDEVESVLAAREAVAALGAEVVGVSCVVATSAALLDALKTAQLLFSCSWTPPPGTQVSASGDQSITRSIAPAGDPVVVDYNCSCHQPAPKRKRSIEEEEAANGAQEPAASPPPPFLMHVTAHYQGNNPSEDRSFNAEKSGEDGVRVNAVFDGHGGGFAVEHLRKTLCQRILSQVSADADAEQVFECLKLAFAQCDDELKQSLLALPAETHLSKGFCNSGACAAVALFVNATLYVANVGDCAVVLGKSAAGSAKCVATQLSVDHTCDNAEEIRLVLERSRDRNPVRLSKDDQASNAGGFGVKRVAGSLAVTRAFGDFYLKCEELSSAPFKSKLPYITVEPSVAAVPLDGTEKYLILGSDGLWEVLTADEAVQIVDSFDPAQSLFFSSASAALIHAALEKIAHRDGLMLHEVLALPPGPARRRFHDDITCTIVYMTDDERSAGESPPVGDIVSATPTAAANEESPPDALS